MYPKFFFERFWVGDQRNELFVCMPFHDSFDDKLEWGSGHGNNMI